MSEILTRRKEWNVRKEKRILQNETPCEECIYPNPRESCDRALKEWEAKANPPRKQKLVSTVRESLEVILS